jgi:2-keto-4-pentenoate hydratase/2-oxohepta-3-ene-1,7-dioic acid hydratase in catechol pathway
MGMLSPDDRHVIDLRTAQRESGIQADPLPDNLPALLDAGGAARDLAARLCESALDGDVPESLHSVEDIGLLAPVPLPASIRDCMCFEEHLLGAMRTVVRWRFPPLAALDGFARKLFGRGVIKVPAVWHEQPLYYKGNPHSVVGHGAEVRWPAGTERLDFELEIGVFIGRGGKDIPESRAAEHIAGYTIFNDFSARDVQLREMQGRLGPAKGKDFDTGNVIGPCLVTPDEVPTPYDLAAEVRVNGETWSSSSTASMRFSFEEIIAYISRDETLHVGDFIGAGTLPGGCGLELDRWIKPGDTVELQIDRLGTLRNRVVREDTRDTPSAVDAGR